MKRILFSFLLAVGLTITPIFTASASTDGCPDTWKIDTSSNSGYEELTKAKYRLGSDLAISEPVIQYQNYSGELGPIAPPKDKSLLTIEDVYLYGKTQVLWKIDVQQKNCASKVTFVFNRGTLSSYLGFTNVYSNVDPQAWAVANESSFVDFTKAAQFESCIRAQQRILSPSNLTAEPLRNQLLVGALGAVIRQRTYRDPCGLSRVNQRRYLVYQDLTPECRFFTEESDRTTAIPKNGACEIALALPTRESLIIFSKFEIKAKDFEVKVTCVKGKLSKKLTTYKGYEDRIKCPAGYKKK